MDISNENEEPLLVNDTIVELSTNYNNEEKIDMDKFPEIGFGIKRNKTHNGIQLLKTKTEYFELLAEFPVNLNEAEIRRLIVHLNHESTVEDFLNCLLVFSGRPYNINIKKEVKTYLTRAVGLNVQ
jgi:hypothetical protein